MVKTRNKSIAILSSFPHMLISTKRVSETQNEMKILLKMTAYSQDENGKYLNLEYIRTNLVETDKPTAIEMLDKMVDIKNNNAKSIAE